MSETGMSDMVGNMEIEEKQISGMGTAVPPLGVVGPVRLAADLVPSVKEVEARLERNRAEAGVLRALLKLAKRAEGRNE